MNVITDEGKTLLTRIDKNKLVFTRAMFDTGQNLTIIGSLSEDNLFTLQLRIDNINLSAGIDYKQIIVYAKIEGDDEDVIYSNITKNGSIPSPNTIPEYVEDIDICFVFSDIDSITIQQIENVYALNKDLLKKPDLFVGINKPEIVNSPYIWYQTFGDDIGFAGSDYEPELVITESEATHLTFSLSEKEEIPLNIEITEEVNVVELTKEITKEEINVVENTEEVSNKTPLEFIIKM